MIKYANMILHFETNLIETMYYVQIPYKCTSQVFSYPTKATFSSHLALLKC